MATAIWSLQESFLAILQSLADKEQAVISRRIGLSWQRETLQEIGNDYKITRERVRQIEEVGIKKIGRIVKSTPLSRIQEIGKEIISLHGWLMTRDRLVNAILKEMNLGSTFNVNIIDVLLQSDFNLQKSKPQLGTRTYFHLPEINKKLVDTIHREAVKILKKKGDIIENTVLYENIKIGVFPFFGKVETVLIDSVVDVFLDIVKGEEKFVGLEKWKILNPSTLKDKTIYILKKKKEPMHFIEITNAITEHFHEPVKVSTIHNELIRNGEFVLIGRGIYVLKDWWYHDGTVLDVIMEIFQKANSALSKEEITARVLKTRKVKETTIYMNLQNKKYIERVGRNLYAAKQ